MNKEKQKEYAKKWKVNHRAQGLCSNCSQKSLPGQTRCEYHAKAHRKYATKSYHKLKGGETMKKYKHMTPKDFDVIKTLANVGLTLGKIVDVTGRSTATVSVVKLSSDFEDYRRRIHEMLARKTKNKTANNVPQVDTRDDSSVSNEGQLVRIENLINRVLEGQATTNTLLESLLTSSPEKKRGIFG